MYARFLDTTLDEHAPRKLETTPRKRYSGHAGQLGDEGVREHEMNANIDKEIAQSRGEENGEGGEKEKEQK